MRALSLPPFGFGTLDQGFFNFPVHAGPLAEYTLALAAQFPVNVA